MVFVNEKSKLTSKRELDGTRLSYPNSGHDMQEKVRLYAEYILYVIIGYLKREKYGGF